MLPVCLGLNALLRAGFESVLPDRLVRTSRSAAPVAAVARPGPALAAGVAAMAMFALSPAFLSEPATDPAIAAHRERIATEIASLPPRFGPWVGTDVPVPSGAQRILTPNALVCREVRTLEGDGRATFVLVHCGDVRDMLGHWPPVCYRSDGWEREAGDPHEIEVSGEGRPTTRSMRHRFARFRSEGTPERIEVWTAFIAPRAEPTGDLDAFRERAASRGSSSLGIAQLQVVVPVDIPEAERETIVRSILADVPTDVLRALASDPLGESTPTP
jgi:hypothetical protein